MNNLIILIISSWTNIQISKNFFYLKKQREKNTAIVKLYLKRKKKRKD